MRAGSRNRCFRKTALLYLLACILLTGCFSAGGCDADPNREQEGEKSFLSTAHKLHFTYPAHWESVSKRERDGMLTLRLRDSEDSSIQMIVSVVPGPRSTVELVDQAEKILRDSLYHVSAAVEYDTQEYAGRPVTLLTVEAGDKDKVMTRTAVFSEKENSYFFILISGKEIFSTALSVFEKILSTIEIK